HHRKETHADVGGGKERGNEIQSFAQSALRRIRSLLIVVSHRSRNPPNDGNATADAITFRNSDLHVRGQQYVSTRTELDHSEAFAEIQSVASAFPANDAPGEYAGDLFADDRDLLALNREGILLVYDARLLVSGHQELSRRVNHVHDPARYRRA